MCNVPEWKDSQVLDVSDFTAFSYSCKVITVVFTHFCKAHPMSQVLGGVPKMSKSAAETQSW